MLVASALPATTYAQSKVQQKSLPTFSHQEKQQAILKKLHAEAIYDAKTEVSYVFRDTIPSDMDTLAVAARHNIFFAHNDGLLVEIYGNEDDIKNIFAGYGGSYEQVAV